LTAEAHRQGIGKRKEGEEEEGKEERVKERV
jgi:hypothetical protein